MARRVVNRLVLREENDAAERMDEELDEAPADKVVKKAPVRRKSRAKVVKEVSP